MPSPVLYHKNRKLLGVNWAIVQGLRSHTRHKEDNGNGSQ